MFMFYSWKIIFFFQEVALKAVLNHGRALEFASERLRGDFASQL